MKNGNANGHIKLFRRILAWRWYCDSPTKDLFLHLLLTCSRQAVEFKGIKLNEGERAVTLKALTNELNLSMQTVRTALSHLLETGEIEKRTERGITVIKIVKWAEYQDVGAQEVARANSISAEIKNAFEKIYGLYSRKGNKEEARTVYLERVGNLSADKQKDYVRKLYVLLERQIKVWEEEDRDIAYTPFLANWLRSNAPPTN